MILILTRAVHVGPLVINIIIIIIIIIMIIIIIIIIMLKHRVFVS